LMALENITINFTDSALDYIVEKAVEFKLGARGLRSICEAIMTDAMFELPSHNTKNKLTINKSYASEKLKKTKIHKLKAA
jgi:ATP-dependent Clp protease ATP-binding subunit ClpX